MTIKSANASIHPSNNDSTILGFTVREISTLRQREGSADSHPARRLQSSYEALMVVKEGVNFFDREQYECHPLVAEVLLAISQNSLERAARNFGSACDCMLLRATEVGTVSPDLRRGVN